LTLCCYCPITQVRIVRPYVSHISRLEGSRFDEKKRVENLGG
jgi:hypothetical protein